MRGAGAWRWGPLTWALTPYRERRGAPPIIDEAIEARDAELFIPAMLENDARLPLRESKVG